MNNSDLGRAHAFLLRHRYIETKSVRRSVSKEEREIATMLRDAEPAMKELLREFLQGEGLELKEYNDLDAKGIALGATVFAVVRLPDTNAPFFGYERLTSRMRQAKGVDSDIAAKVWFTQIWFVHLDLLYTRRNRASSEMQGYVETSFAREVLVNAVKDYINDHVRKLEKESLENDAIYKFLTAEKGGRVSSCCDAFLDLMLEAGLLELIGPNTFRQTLLSAVEMKLNFDRQLAPLLPVGDPSGSTRSLLIREEEQSELMRSE
jgi:hypothetical protein